MQNNLSSRSQFYRLPHKWRSTLCFRIHYKLINLAFSRWILEKAAPFLVQGEDKEKEAPFPVPGEDKEKEAKYPFTN